MLAILTPKNLNPVHCWDAGFGPFLVGIIVWAIGLSLGGPTGYAINPARDLGPRIAHALLPIAGKGNSDWGYAWIPVAGPFFFSSRRRHTSYIGDWSSDVCSSDLKKIFF